jgi:hypothetical protein
MQLDSFASSPGLFGIKYSNRDFSLRETWGKNLFNSSFPVALASFLDFKGFASVYLTLGPHRRVNHQKISASDLWGTKSYAENLFFAFESSFAPWEQLVSGRLPRVDLVTQERDSKRALKGLEIKLTALPDNSTCDFSEDKFGCEIVARPDTIVYLACSMAATFEHSRHVLQSGLRGGEGIKNWTSAEEVLPFVPQLIENIEVISRSIAAKGFEEPLVLQPIWKTEGKSHRLAEHCLDVFVWSNLAFAQIICNVATEEIKVKKITRPVRTAIWLFKMLYDFAQNGQINHARIIDNLSFNTKNDKAFALNGRVTQHYMACPELIKPRITKHQIKEIILGNGQNLLSPERRFDAVIFNSPELFNSPN